LSPDAERDFQVDAASNRRCREPGTTEIERSDGTEAIAEGNIARLIQLLRSRPLRFEERHGNHLAGVQFRTSRILAANG
jgi:hypothetical protein